MKTQKVGRPVNLRSLVQWWKSKTASLKEDIITLSYALRHPGTPWYAKFFLVLVVAYAVSPLDLIPDFIPVIGLLDDLLLIPLGVVLAGKMIPAAVWAECRHTARAGVTPRSLYLLGIFIVIAAWIGLGLLLARLLV